jgi:hypothetical protein
MKIAFHSNQLSLRGTEVALYDYAHFNEQLLGNSSIIVTPRQANGHNELSAQKFASRFPVIGYEGTDELEQLLAAHNVDALYCIKSGQNDGIISTRRRTLVHSVFGYCEPHGDIYAYVSDWLSQYASGGRYPAVPHIVSPLPMSGNLRRELGIPDDAIVFGRHGGSDTFDLPFAQIVVQELARQTDNIFFLFLGTEHFCAPHPRIIHLPATADLTAKSKFINSCDAMLHARSSGETFGLAIAEFSTLNKPVLTYSESNERAHIDILKENALYYNDPVTLTQQLLSFKPQPARNWRMYAEAFTPELVMKRFKEVFLTEQ